MLDVIGSIWWLLVVLGILVTFHEYGHYWVARRMGVRVLRFSVGFGRPLWKRLGRDGTEYVVAGIPLGGYVKMLDSREGPVPPGQLGEEFNGKALWQRTAIVAAGPAFNLVFAVFAFWLMFLVGIPDIRPLAGPTSGLLEEAGVREGDLLVAVDGQPVATLGQFNIELVTHGLDRRDIELTTEDQNGRQRSHQLALSQLPDSFSEERALSEIGFSPWQPRREARISQVVEGSAAEAAGLQEGDLVTAIGGEAVSDWRRIGPLVQEQMNGNNAGDPLRVDIERRGQPLELSLNPERAEAGGPWLLGIAGPELTADQQQAIERMYITRQFGPVEGLGRAVRECWDLTTATLGIMWRMITGSASVKNLSGPITIAQVANDSAQQGFTRFLFFLGLISLSLGIINLLPIPLLDGGHLLFYAIEWVKGSPVSVRMQSAGQMLGIVLLGGLMSLAFINDILRLFG